MTTAQLLRDAVRIWPPKQIEDRRTRRHLQRGWIESVKTLGPNWILAKRVERVQ